MTTTKIQTDTLQAVKKVLPHLTDNMTQLQFIDRAVHKAITDTHMFARTKNGYVTVGDRVLDGDRILLITSVMISDDNGIIRFKDSNGTVSKTTVSEGTIWHMIPIKEDTNAITK